MIRAARLALCASAAFALGAPAAMSAQVFTNFHLATPDGPGASVGSAIIKDGADGAVIQLNLHGLPPGPHGFHIHEHGSCAPKMKDGMPMPAADAGGHWDPDLSGSHQGPEGHGHKGDLPFVTVGPDGSDSETLVAPRIRDVASLVGKTLMIHAGGDNYADKPAPLGGGGARIACGVLQ
jgi:Cu-Zn family superoxide dismutase